MVACFFNHYRMSTEKTRETALDLSPGDFLQTPPARDNICYPTAPCQWQPKKMTYPTIIHMGRAHNVHVL